MSDHTLVKPYMQGSVHACSRVRINAHVHARSLMLSFATARVLAANSSSVKLDDCTQEMRVYVAAIAAVISATRSNRLWRQSRRPLLMDPARRISAK